MPHPDAGALTPYRDELEPRDFQVAGTHLIVRDGEQPVLPRICASCGSTERGGEDVDRALFWTPRWIYATFLVSPLLYPIAYFATRKSLQTQYYLCPKCAAKYSASRKLTSMSWATLGAAMAVGVVFGAAEVVLLSSLAVFMVMLAMVFMIRPPVKISSYDEGTFVLKLQDKSFAHKITNPQRQLPTMQPNPTARAQTPPFMLERSKYQAPQPPQRPVQPAPQRQSPGPLGTDGSI